MREIVKSDLISPADGNVVETLTDPRVLATGVGVIGAAFGERALWKAARAQFGYAVPGPDGRPIYYGAKADGTQDTAPAPKLGVNRQLARGVLVVGAVAGIEFIDNAPAQYGLLGVAALLLAHVAQDAFPALNK